MNVDIIFDQYLDKNNGCYGKPPAGAHMLTMNSNQHTVAWTTFIIQTQIFVLSGSQSPQETFETHTLQIKILSV